MIECGLFSHFLGFAAWQVILLAIIYAGIFAIVVRVFIRSSRAQTESNRIARWRAVSIAPMLVAVIGSFASLPLLLFVALLGNV